MCKYKYDTISGSETTFYIIMDKLDKFFKYHDIKSKPLPGEFIVTEKIHGSNFGICYTENLL